MMKSSVIFFLICTTFFAGVLMVFSDSPVGAAEDKVIELKFAAPLPPNPGHPYLLWAKEIEKQTNGRVKINIFWGSSLVNPQSVRISTLKGLCDLSWSALSMDASAYPMNLVIELPFMGFPNTEVAQRVRTEIIDKFPEVKAEYKGTKIMWISANLARYLHSRKKPIRTPEDLKGEKIASLGIYTRIIDAAGGSPVTIMVQDKYMALERGVVDGSIDTYAGMQTLKFINLLPYHNSTILSIGCSQILMNMRTWNKLSPDIQKVFNDVNPYFGDRANNEFVSKLDKAGLSTAERLGHTFIQNTPEELAQWHEKMKPIHEKWINENEAKGLPARGVYGEVKRLIKEYSK